MNHTLKITWFICSIRTSLGKNQTNVEWVQVVLLRVHLSVKISNKLHKQTYIKRHRLAVRDRAKCVVPYKPSKIIRCQMQELVLWSRINSKLNQIKKDSVLWTWLLMKPTPMKMLEGEVINYASAIKHSRNKIHKGLDL